MVGSDAHGAAEIFAEFDQRGEFGTDTVEFLLILGVGVLADFEFFLIGVVAGIDADFFHPFGSFESGVRLEMDVSDERHLAACGAHLAGDVFQIRGVDFRLCGDSHHFAAGVCEAEDFRDAGGGVAGVRGDHRLHADRVMRAYADVSDHHLAGDSAGVVQ